MHLKTKILIGVFLISLIFFIPFFYIQEQNKLNSINDKPPSTAIDEEEILLPGRTNILVLGDDSRPGESRARTDTIMLISLDQETKQMAILSIPRDTRVNIPGRGYDRINAAYSYGGADLAINTVSDLLDVEINYYVHTNFEGFIDIIDTLGGVTLNIEQNMYYAPEGINLKKGEQLLDGDKALQFVRYRNYPLGDITRTQQQQKLIKALTTEAMQLSTITKLPKLLPQLESAIDTNFSFSDTLLLMRMAKQFTSPDIITQTLPGNFQNINGIEYWQINSDEAKQVVKDLFSGKTSSNLIVPISS